MVLDDPGVVDADAVGELDLLDDAAIMRLRVAHGRQIGRQIEQPEFHGSVPRVRRPVAQPAAVRMIWQQWFYCRYFFAAASNAS